MTAKQPVNVRDLLNSCRMPAHVDTHDNPSGVSADSMTARHAERRYDLFVRRHLTRNYLAHLTHGLLGQTGFRLLNAPTFLPAYLMLLSGGSSFVVGLGTSLQAFGNMVTPLFGASLIEHRRRVLPVSFVTGLLMRLSVLAIALAGLLFEPDTALVLVLCGLLAFGLCSGAQQVTFGFLMSKVIPVRSRGRLTGLRNFLAGITSAGVAAVSGSLLLGDVPDAHGYSYTFVLAFVLTMCGLMCLLIIREPQPPSVRRRTPLWQRLADVPQLLREDSAYAGFVLARGLATTGRMALPFYILYAGTGLGLSGSTLATVTVAFTLAATSSNLLWGALADRAGFRLVFVASTLLWIAATCGLFAARDLFAVSAIFACIGAAVQGFQSSSMNLTLEFGSRDDLPVRIAIATTAAEVAGALGPLAGGLIAAFYGHEAVFAVSIVFLALGSVLTLRFVPDPRHGAR